MVIGVSFGTLVEIAFFGWVAGIVTTFVVAAIIRNKLKKKG